MNLKAKLKDALVDRLLRAMVEFRKKEMGLRDELAKADADPAYVKISGSMKKVKSDQRGVLGIHLDPDWVSHLVGSLLGSSVKFGFTARRDFLVGAWAVEGKPYHVEKGTMLWAEIGESFNQLRIGGCDVRKLMGDGLVDAPAILRPFLKGKPTDRPVVKLGPANQVGSVGGEWSRDMAGPGNPADESIFDFDNPPADEDEAMGRMWDMKELDRLDAAWRKAYGMVVKEKTEEAVQGKEVPVEDLPDLVPPIALLTVRTRIGKGKVFETVVPKEEFRLIELVKAALNIAGKDWDPMDCHVQIGKTCYHITSTLPTILMTAKPTVQITRKPAKKARKTK